MAAKIKMSLLGNTQIVQGVNGQASGDAAKPKFTIKTPNTGFKGERGGLRFLDGVATTDDAIKAHMCLEFGYDVLLTEGMKEAFPKNVDESSRDDGAKKKKK